jgi:hypothetical protein
MIYVLLIVELEKIATMRLAHACRVS